MLLNRKCNEKKNSYELCGDGQKKIYLKFSYIFDWSIFLRLEILIILFSCDNSASIF